MEKRNDFILANDLTNKLAFLTFNLFVEKENKAKCDMLKKEIKETTKKINDLYKKHGIL